MGRADLDADLLYKMRILSRRIQDQPGFFLSVGEKAEMFWLSLLLSFFIPADYIKTGGSDNEDENKAGSIDGNVWSSGGSSDAV